MKIILMNKMCENQSEPKWTSGLAYNWSLGLEEDAHILLVI